MLIKIFKTKRLLYLIFALLAYSGCNCEDTPTNTYLDSSEESIGEQYLDISFQDVFKDFQEVQDSTTQDITTEDMDVLDSIDIEEDRGDIGSDIEDSSDAGDCQCELQCNVINWSCNSLTGLNEPLPVCSETNPCRCLSEEYRKECICEITSTSPIPTCRTGKLGADRGRIIVDDGPPLTRIDEDGTTRYACLFRPKDASKQNKYPLVIWLHGGGSGSADGLYDNTSLREKADPSSASAFDLTGDGRKGFILLAVQGRFLHYPTDYPRDGVHHDFYHRDLNQPSTNRDISNLDYWIDHLVEQGDIDEKRIYLMGWSNGCFFAQLYTFARYNTPTPRGNRVAAVACYAGADPFENINKHQTPSCKVSPYPTTKAPILILGRNCDVPTCNEEQANNFANQGIDIEPGHIVEPWVNLAKSGVAINLERVILDGASRIVSNCLNATECSYSRAIFNHIRWPDGKASYDLTDREPLMLEFLREHPLQ